MNASDRLIHGLIDWLISRLLMNQVLTDHDQCSSITAEAILPYIHGVVERNSVDWVFFWFCMLTDGYFCRFSYFTHNTSQTELISGIELRRNILIINSSLLCEHFVWKTLSGTNIMFSGTIIMFLSIFFLNRDQGCERLKTRRQRNNI